MIKANELRIGNWIRTITGNYEQVVDVMCDSVNTLKGGGIMDDIDPIPLTPEILEKCGLIKLNNSWIADDGSRDEHGSIICGTYTFSIFGYNCSELYYGKFHVEHLHQLQNLYFALTGTEINYTP